MEHSAAPGDFLEGDSRNHQSDTRTHVVIWTILRWRWLLKLVDHEPFESQQMGACIVALGKVLWTLSVSWSSDPLRRAMPMYTLGHLMV
jgi:hypothetical protein